MDNSPFGRLPAELRIKIYEYALTFDRVGCRPGESSRFWPERSLSAQLALTRVCKQIRSETLHLPFTLNNPIVGHAYWGTDFTEAMRAADEVTRNVASIPAELLSESTAFSLSLNGEAKRMLTSDGDYGRGVSVMFLLVVLRSFFGKLLDTPQTHDLLLDLTPGEKYITPKLWCDAGDSYPSGLSRELRFELNAEKTTVEVFTTQGDMPFAAFNHTRALAMIRQHQDHDRSLCNVAKHGEQLMARVASLENKSGSFVDRRNAKCLRGRT